MFKTHDIATRDITDFLRWSILLHGGLVVLIATLLLQGIADPFTAAVLMAFLAGMAAVMAVWYWAEYHRDFKSHYDSKEGQ